MRGRAVLRVLTAMCALAGIAAPASASPVADFYRGKTISITHTGGAGGTFAAYSRLLARPLVVHQDVPAERIAALRAAFDATMADPAFKADAAKRRLAPSPPMGWCETTAYVQTIASLPQHVIDEYKAAIE